jgi:SAM-dependent methyltransferase
MKRVDSWRPSKAEHDGARWRASRNPREVMVGSRFAADLFVRAYESVIRMHAGGVLADVGCGKMPYYGIYRDQVQDVIGIDWPSSSHDSPYVDVLCDLNERIDLSDRSVDTVLCTDVLEHIYRPSVLWHEIARILRPGGIAIVATPFLYRIHEAPHDYHRYTGFALDRYARDAGLEVLSLQPIGGLPCALVDIMCRATQKAPPIAGAIAGVAHRALRIGPLRRAVARSAHWYPLAYVMTAGKPSTGGSRPRTH